jgi:glycosyltransferase 2 family protein
MRDLARVITRAFHDKIGWHRIGIAVGVMIVVIALAALFRLLRDIEIEKVLVAIRAISPHEIILACGFIALGYVTLTFYDYFSLRTIGRRDVPYRIAAMASFISYTIGHNLGATVFTGGTIRFRIYSAWGLGVVDVVKIAFVTGLTFWLGNAFVLGVGMLCVPEAAGAINHLPYWINRAIGLSGLLVIVGYLAWLLPRPRNIGRADWRITLPNARLTLVQIGIGVLDLSVGGLAMYVLLPEQPSIVFIVLLVTFVTATLLGFLSHAPGSLGVFEAAMLIALPQFQKEALLASLLIFRLSYYVLPFCLAVLLLCVRECWLASRAPADATDAPAVRAAGCVEVVEDTDACRVQARERFMLWPPAPPGPSAKDRVQDS